MQRGRVAQRDVVDLDVLARRDVALVERRVLLDALAKASICSGDDAAERELDADHLHVGLALAVDALLEPEADELVLRGLPVEELLGLVVEVVELALEDRDDVARDVLADLGVRERPRSAGRGRRLHPPKVAKGDCLTDIFAGGAAGRLDPAPGGLAIDALEQGGAHPRAGARGARRPPAARCRG